MNLVEFLIQKLHKFCYIANNLINVSCKCINENHEAKRLLANDKYLSNSNNNLIN